MVAYSFNPRFVDPILNGAKTQTIRLIGNKRHARPGELIQLYTGMRTRQCRKICDDVRCVSDHQIHIDFGQEGQIEGIKVGILRIIDFDAFAAMDGFADAADMAAFWKATHGASQRFSGALIRWKRA
jgi:hypothetical protein